MSLTLVVLVSRALRAAEGLEPLAITLDSPRIVIGRGEGCDVRLPDLGVSHRHASIRQRGPELVIVDEGSTNGTVVEGVRLGAQSPQTLRNGDKIRVGRVWLEVRMDASLPAPQPALAAEALALELVARGLVAQDEDGRPRIMVSDGPAAGSSLTLSDPSRRVVIGKAKEADLVIDDSALARRHVEVGQRGKEVVVRDAGAPSPALLDGTPLGRGDTVWRAGKLLTVGSSSLSLAHPALEALLEIERGEGERLRPEDVDEAPAEPEPTPSEPAAAEVAAPTPAPPPAVVRVDERAGWNLTDGAVVLVAIGVLAVSLVGLYWLFQ